MGAGVLLRSRDPSGKRVVLLGREAEDGKWRDFGGGKEGKETPLATACREASEESNGLLGSPLEVRKLIHERNAAVLSDANGTYTTYVIDLPHGELQAFLAYYTRSIRFLNENFECARNTEGLMEKDQAKIVGLDQVRRMSLPRWYKPVVISALGGRNASRN